MRLMRILIVIILCVKSLYRALPVQSKALENIDDQLFWQVAWFSENSKPASPFTSDSKKITAKSIFITPNFVNQPAQYCPDGYRIDNGKCIKVINIQQTSDELLATRLASLITTDTTSFEYDYDSVEDEQQQNQHHNDNKNDVENQEEIKLPLVPILHESNEEDTDNSFSSSNNNDNDNDNFNAKNVTVKEQEPITATTDNLFMTSSHTFHDFHAENKTDSVEIIITTLSSDDERNSYSSTSNSNSSQITTYEYDNAATIKPSVDELKMMEENNDDANVNFSSSTITPTFVDSLEPATTLEYENITEINSNENETSVMQDRSNEDKQNVEPSSQFLLLLPMAESLERENSTKMNNFTSIDNSTSSNSTNDDDDDYDEILSNSTVLDFNENSQTEEAIIESSDTINFDDSSFLLNDSLIMIDNNASSIITSGSSAVDYDDITTVDPFNIKPDEEQTTLLSNTDDSLTEQQQQTEETLHKEDHDKFETTSYYSNVDHETNKFVYHHHVPVEITTVVPPQLIETSTTSTIGNKLKFPDEEINRRVRFPDDDVDVYGNKNNNNNNNNEKIVTTPSRIQSRLLLPSSASTRFSWPRENNNPRLATNIFQFWNQQPLLNDYQRAKENSKSFRGDDFFPYTRKVQIVTPQRYNY